MDVREKLRRIVKEAIHSWESDVNMSDHITDNLIANGVTVLEWISVTDMLPENGQRVLVADCGFCYDVWVFCGDCWEDSHGWWRCFDEVSHWMPLPLPQPPKEV